MKCRLLLFILLFSGFGSLHSQNLDIELLQRINGIEAGNGFNHAMLFVSDAELFVEAGGVLGMGVVGLVKQDVKLLETSVSTSVALGANLIITLALKRAVQRPRPMQTYPDLIINHGLYKANNRSFPSGHTSSVFTFATAITLAYPEWYVAVPLYAWASTVAFSRMYLGAHYPSDVLAGVLLGIGNAYVNHRVKEWLLHDFQKPITVSNATLAYSGFR